MAYTDTVLPKILGKADALWADNQAKVQYEAKTDAWEALRRVNTARINTQLNGGKDRTVRVGWINACDIVVDDCNNACSPTHPELTTTAVDYTIGTCKEAGFRVPEETFRNNLFDYEDIVAQGMLKAMKELDETIVKGFISFLNANGGVNVWDGDKWTVSSTNTNVPNANWTLGLMFDFQYAAARNRFMAPLLLSGYNLAEPIFTAKTNAGNDNGKGDAARLGTLPLVQDFFNVEAVNTDEEDVVTYKSYMVDTGAVAFASKNYYDRNPRTLEGGVGHVLFSRPSQNLPGVIYDIVYQTTCVSGVYYHTYTLEAHYDFFLNPTGCDNTSRTGILEFVRVS